MSQVTEGPRTGGWRSRKRLTYVALAVVIIVIVGSVSAYYLLQRPKLVIYSTLDTLSASALLEDFKQKNPQTDVQYFDLGSADIYTRYLTERSASQPTADILWSTGADLQYALLKNNSALAYRVANYDSLPDNAKYQTLAYVSSYALVAPIYNTQKIPASMKPTSMKDTADLLANRSLFPAASQSVGTFDVAKSGFGLTFTYYLNKTHPELIQQQLTNASAIQPLAQTSTGTLLEKVKTGELGLVTNSIANYAFRDAPANSVIGAFIANDAVVLVPRAIFITKESAHPLEAQRFLDFILSSEGQTDLASAAEVTQGANAKYPALSVGSIQGNTTDAVIVKLGDAYLEDLLSPSLKAQFISQWKQWLNRP
jgi:iron(III) transport system substrate-binding protein